MGCCDTDVVKMSLDPAADTAVCGPSHPVSLDTGNVLLPSPREKSPALLWNPQLWKVSSLAPVHGIHVDSLSPHSWCIQHCIKGASLEGSRCNTSGVGNGVAQVLTPSGLGKIEWDAF